MLPTFLSEDSVSLSLLTMIIDGAEGATTKLYSLFVYLLIEMYTYFRLCMTSSSVGRKRESTIMSISSKDLHVISFKSISMHLRCTTL